MRTPRAEEKPKLRRGLGNRTRAAIKAEDDVAEANRRKRRRRVWELRTESKMTLDAIAEATGSAYSTVKDDLRWCLDQFRPSNVAEVRAEEEANLARIAQELKLGRQIVLQRISFADKLDKDGRPVVSHDEVLALLDRLTRLDRESTRNSESRRRLLGANAPVVVEVSGAVAVDHEHVVRVSLDDVVRTAAKNAGEAAPKGLLNGKSPEDGEALQ